MFLRRYQNVGVYDDKFILKKDAGIKTAEGARRLIMKGHLRGDYDAHALGCLAQQLNSRIV